jgi:hypothetical protein
MSEHHSHAIRVIQPVSNRCWECNARSSNIIIHTFGRSTQQLNNGPVVVAIWFGRTFHRPPPGLICAAHA